MDYLAHIGVIICFYVILSLSLDLVVGYTGILSIAQGAFYGIGAYTSALLAVHFGFSLFEGLIASILFGAIISLVIILPALRVGGFYLIMISLAFQEIVYSIMLNWNSLTKGPAGVTNIPRPEIFGQPIDNVWIFFVFTIILAIAIFVICKKIVNSPFGIVLRAIKEDEIATAAIGKNVKLFKTLILMIAGAIAGLAGGLYAFYMGYISPDNFTFEASFFILSIVLVGGAGTLRGPLVAAIVLVAIPEIFRFLGMPSSVAGPLRQIMYSVLLIGVLRFRSQGLFKPKQPILKTEES